MKLSTFGRFRRFVFRGLRLAAYLERPGDGRQQPRIAACDLLWSLLAGQTLRDPSHHAVEALVRSPARRALGVARRFGDDTLSYFTERLFSPGTRRLVGISINPWAFGDIKVRFTVSGRTAPRSTCSIKNLA